MKPKSHKEMQEVFLRMDYVFYLSDLWGQQMKEDIAAMYAGWLLMDYPSFNEMRLIDEESAGLGALFG